MIKIQRKWDAKFNRQTYPPIHKKFFFKKLFEKFFIFKKNFLKNFLKNFFLPQKILLRNFPFLLRDFPTFY